MSVHPVAELAEYVSGALREDAARAVRAHLAGCAECQAEVTLWHAVGDAVSSKSASPPVDAVAVALRRAALTPEPVAPRAGLGRHARFAAQLLLAQLRLVRLSVWVASVLVMGLGVVVALMGTQSGTSPDWTGFVLAMMAPIVAAAGIAGVCAPERAPGFEYVSAAVTSPRVVLLARVTVVFGYNLVLAVVSSAVLAGTGAASGLLTIVEAWLGPMALLSSLCLLLSVVAGSTAATAVALTLWVARLLAPGLAVDAAWLAPVADGITALWSTNLLTGLLTVVLLCAAVALAGKVRHRPAAA